MHISCHLAGVLAGVLGNQAAGLMIASGSPHTLWGWAQGTGLGGRREGRWGGLCSPQAQEIPQGVGQAPERVWGRESRGNQVGSPGDGGQEPGGQRTQARFSRRPRSGPECSLGTGGPRRPARPPIRHPGGCRHFCRDPGCLLLAPRPCRGGRRCGRRGNPRAVLVRPSVGPQPERHSRPAERGCCPLVVRARRAGS